MTHPVCLDIPIGATVTLTDPISCRPPSSIDARELMHRAAKAAKGRVYDRGNTGTRYDVIFREAAAELVWSLSGGQELQRMFAARKS